MKRRVVWSWSLRGWVQDGTHVWLWCGDVGLDLEHEDVGAVPPRVVNGLQESGWLTRPLKTGWLLMPIDAHPLNWFRAKAEATA